MVLCSFDLCLPARLCRYIGVVNSVTVKVINLDAKSSLNLNALSGSSVHFHTSSFVSKVSPGCQSLQHCRSPRLLTITVDFDRKTI